MGKGAIPEDHPLWAGTVGIQTSQPFANQLFLESDLVVAIGARFGDRHTGDARRLPGRADVHPHRHLAAADRQGVCARSRNRRRCRRWRSGRCRAEAQRTGPGGRVRRGSGRLAELRADPCAQDGLRRRRRSGRRASTESSTRSSTEDDTVVTAIGLYQIFGGQFQRPTSRATTFAAARPARSAGRCRRASAQSSPRPRSSVVGDRRRLLLPVPDGGDRGRRPVRHPIRARDAQQRLHGADPSGRESAMA